jgi:uncharacterized OB-fold protein
LDIDKDLGARTPGDHLQPVTDIRMEPGEHLGGAGGERLLQGSECASCGEKAFPTRAFCPACGGRDLVTISLPAEGTLYSYSVVHVSSSRATPYAIGYVDLANGVRVLAGLRGDSTQFRLDEVVRLVVDGDEWSFAPELENGDA